MIQEADTSEIEKTFTFVNSFREDILEEKDFDRNTIFTNIPQKSNDNYVKVAKVLKK